MANLAPSRSTLDAWIRSPLDARNAAIATGTGVVQVVRPLLTDQRRKHNNLDPICGGAEITRPFAGDITDYLNFTMNIAPADPLPTLAEARAWTLQGVSSGATYDLDSLTPTADCEQEPSFGAFGFTAVYASIAGEVDPVLSEFFPDEHQYIRRNDSFRQVFITTFFCGDPPLTPLFTDGEGVNII